MCVRIRMATGDDAGPVRAIYAPIVETTAISFELSVPSEDEVRTRITDRQPAYPWLVIENEHDIAGYAYAGRFAGRAAYDWSVETSVYVSEHARGQGVGLAVYTALLALLIAQGYQQAMAGIALPNPASVALHERTGFVSGGMYRAAGWKFGAWHDVAWWQRALAATDGPPSAPIPLNALPEETLADVLGSAGRSRG